MTTNLANRDYLRVERALHFLREHRDEQPGLDETAAHVGLSPSHFQRLFSRWAGISPKRFLQFLTVAQARRCLVETRSVLEASFEAGLSSPGRLHDLLVTVDAVTPGELRRGGAGLTIRYGRRSSPFGSCFIGVTDRGVCWMSFVDGQSVSALDALRQLFHRAHLVEDAATAGDWLDRIFAPSDGERAPVPVLLAGTNFQLKVWEALLRVPAGGLCSYSGLAEGIGRPKAARAVGSAVAANHIAYLIPCHRVIRAMGDLGDYRWGALRKQAIIGWEQARRLGDTG